MASSEEEFEKALKRFQNRLTQKELADFQFTSLEDVRTLIGKIQTDQRTEKRMMNMNRIKRFLEGMNEFGKVINIFSNSSAMVAAVWGPVKFLLQIASTWADAFEILLDAYEKIGEQIPLLQQFRSLFIESEDMKRVLALMYSDILDFHQHAVRFFADKTWKTLLKSTWKHFDAKFKHILDALSRHKQLVESQGSLLHFREYQSDRDRVFALFEEQEQKHTNDRYTATLQWLCGAENAVEFQKACDAREGSPATGQWILDNPTVKRWKDEQMPPSSLLWMHGIPGAGKSVLASVIIQQCQRSCDFKTSYFFCVKDDPQNNTAVSILRGLLCQLLSQCDDMLPFCYERMRTSGEATLNSLESAKRLFEVFCEKLPKQYVIIDGLDECVREEINTLLTFMDRVVGRYDSVEPGRLRLLIVSQHLSDIQKRLSNPEVLDIQPAHTASDIRNFVEHQLAGVSEKFDIGKHDVDEIVEKTCRRAAGMFLFAKLVTSNLTHSIDKEEFLEEIYGFPEELHQAYVRIIRRIGIRTKSRPRLWKTVKQLLGWMSCAQRPLRWNEIQAATSMDTVAQEFDLDKKKLRVHIKELCGSLIQQLREDSLTLVHSTARYHIVRTEFVRLVDVECSLTALCLQYLTFPCFEPDIQLSELEPLMLKGHLVFQDYAAAQWFFHLREITRHVDTLRASDRESSETIKDLVTALREFLEMYGEGLCEETILDSSRQRCEKIRNSPLSDAYGSYLMLFDHSERHLRQGYEERNAISIPQLGTALFRNREMLETWTKERHTVELAKATREMYGERWFKCSKATCAWFHEGFKDARARDSHIKAHELPFRCEKPDCLYADMGFKTNKEMEKHVKNFHPSREDAAMTFHAVKAPPAKTPHACHLCSKRFTRGFHLRSHLRAHNGERPFACAECGVAFTRDNDRKRHENIVHARKR